MQAHSWQLVEFGVMEGTSCEAGLGNRQWQSGKAALEGTIAEGLSERWLLSTSVVSGWWGGPCEVVRGGGNAKGEAQGQE